MILLNGHTRYGLPGDGQSYKLEGYESVRVLFSGFHKGYIRVGKRAYAAIFLRNVYGDQWFYISKSRFIDLVSWVDQNKMYAEAFWIEYDPEAKVLEWYADEDVPHREKLRRTASAILIGTVEAQA